MSTTRQRADSGRENLSVPPSRRGKKAITVYFEPDVIKQLKLVGIEEDKSMQDMIAEALNDYFAKHGKRAIAE